MPLLYVYIVQNQINPHVAIGGGGVNYPQADLFAATPEPLGIGRKALVTFPEYVWPA